MASCNDPIPPPAPYVPVLRFTQETGRKAGKRWSYCVCGAHLDEHTGGGSQPWCPPAPEVGPVPACSVRDAEWRGSWRGLPFPTTLVCKPSEVALARGLFGWEIGALPGLTRELEFGPGVDERTRTDWFAAEEPWR